MTQEETIARINEEADKYGFRVPYDGTSEFYDRSAVKAFIAGAKSERNKTIDEFETKLQPLVEFGFVDVSWAEIIKILSSLKVDL